MVDLTAPPRDPAFAGCVGEPQQEIAMTCKRCAKAHEIMSAQFVERAQQMMLIAKPSLVFCDNARTVSVRPYPERIAPFAPAADVDATSRNA